MPLEVEIQRRLSAVLQAACQAPGNWPRFRQVGLIASERPALGASLPADWFDRFTALPPLPKATVRQQPGQFLAGVEDGAYRGSTSGSRGQAYLFFAGTRWNQQRIATRQRFLDWWGITPTVPIVTVASRLMPGRPGDVALVGALTQSLLAHLVTLLREKPVALRGYPSRLCEVAGWLQPPLPPVKAVICTGEPLFEHQQVLLESVFQAPVVNEYGCHEAGIAGFTCPEAGRLHLDTTRCLPEVLDGHLVTTDLWNETMPLIRYQCGDLVQLDDSPCPCGRAGITVRLLGRQEDRIHTRQGLHPPGSVSMPPLSGILHYRFQRQTPTQATLSAQLDPAWPPNQGMRSLQHWAMETFGPLRLTLAPLPTVVPTDEREVAWSDAQWHEALTEKSIVVWLSSNALPTGAARSAAIALKTLMNPYLIGVELPLPLQHQITQLASQSPAPENSIEALICRILLFGASCLTDMTAAQTLYLQALDRLQQRFPVFPPAAHLDALISSLHLPPVVTAPLWERLEAAAWQQTWSLDPLHIQHLLAAFDITRQRRWLSVGPEPSPMAAAFQPLLAVPIGDLSFWVQEFTLAHLLHWAEFLQGQVIFSPPAAPHRVSPFLRAWLSWREAWLRNPTTAGDRLATLQAVAQGPAQVTRSQLEQGYQSLAVGAPLDPDYWIPFIEAHATDFTPQGNAGNADLTPWMPLVRALAKPLWQRGETDRAYRCLVAASLSSRQTAAFERLTQRFHQKQSVLQDLSPWEAEG